MYTLRSARSKAPATDPVQSTISFRKRRRPAMERSLLREAAAAQPEEDSKTLSPPKRNKPGTCVGKSLRPRMTRVRATSAEKKTPHRSPLKECNETTPTKTPPPSAKAVMKRLHFEEPSSVDSVKRALHTAPPTTLLARDSQLNTLNSYITSHLKTKTPSSLYVSGPPGTGKTACLAHVLKDRSNSELLRHTTVISVNCMSIHRPQAIYSIIASQLMGGCKAKSIAALQELIMKHITTAKNMILIVLDEVDQLDCRGQEVLYSLFEWPALKHSKLLLIGIANALDLTDRILPRLQCHTSCQPTLLHFPPYSKDEIALILSSRLNEENSHALFDPMALQFTARKVSAVHGDLRKALDICRRAVEMVEAEHISIKEEATPQPHPPIKVTLRHIAAVISEVYSSAVTVQSSPDTLPLQQKIAVCVLLCLLRRHSKEVTVGKLHEAYARVCRRRQLRAECESEFIGVCGMLESRGIVVLRRAKESRLTKVSLKLNEADLEYAIQDKVLLSSILEQGIPTA